MSNAAENPPKIRVIIARMDGKPGRDGIAFAPGSLKPTTVPITRNFDPLLPPIGTAAIVVDGDNVYAEMEIADPTDVAGKYPALGLTDTITDVSIGFRTISAGEVRELSICADQNTDPRIPPIAQR